MGEDQELPGMPAAPAPADVPPDPKRSRARKSRSRAKTSTSADKAPRSRPARPPRSRVSSAARAEAYGQKLLPLYALAAMGGRFVPGIGEDGSQILLQYSSLMAKSWGPLAAENDAVRALIDKLTESSAVMGVVFSHVAVAGAILAAKGKAPTQLGMLAPVLEALGNDPNSIGPLAGLFDSGASPAQEDAPAHTTVNDNAAAGVPGFANGSR